jgi:hypothetical protein
VTRILPLLARHFFGRLFDNEIVTGSSDMRTNAVEALGIVASPGILVSFYTLPQGLRYDRPLDSGWMVAGNVYFFVLFSMVVMGIVMLLQWDALFPDRRDYLIIAPLPVRERAIFAARTASLLVFLGLFAAGTNLFGAILFPTIMLPSGTPMWVLWKLIGAHAAAVLSAGLFVAMSFASLEGVLINVLTARAFRRISPCIRTTAMALLIAILFLAPFTIAMIRPLFESHAPVLRWFPPFWFLALYIDLLPGRPGGALFHELAPMAGKALAVAAAVFAASYAAGYRRHARRVLETMETAGRGPGRIRTALVRLANRWLLPHPLERATFHFISQTILRSDRHRLLLAVYAGIAIALALPAIVQVAARHGVPTASFTPGGLLAIPLTLSFFLVCGLRAGFNFPAELRANWIFQMTDSAESYRHLRAVRKWIVVVAILPLLALLAPWEVAFCGWWPALVHLVCALVPTLVLLEILLVWFRKIPFTCSYFPGKTSMAIAFSLYLAGFGFYASVSSALERRILRNPLELAAFLAAGGAVLAALRRLGRRELGIDDVLLYEDQPDPVVRSLEIG